MKTLKKTLAIIGAGPAGCMCAYYAQQNCDVTLFDFSSSLHTLLYTGGGRCNLAYAEYDFKELAKFYPRGEKFLYSVFSQFATGDTLDFFENIGVKTYVQDDLRIFPVSDSAKDVRTSMLKALSESQFMKERVIKIEKHSDSFLIKTDNNDYKFDSVVIAVGGHAGFELAKNLGHSIIEPKPSLTGLLTRERFKPIQGVSLKDVRATVIARSAESTTRQSKNTTDLNFLHASPLPPTLSPEGRGRIPFLKEFTIQGDLLFTHEGISGPLAYKISSICAREGFSKENPLVIKLDFIHSGQLCDAESSSGRRTLVDNFQNMLNTNPKKDIKNLVSELVPKSLAEYILRVNNIDLDLKCHQINGKTRDIILKSLTEFEINVVATAKDGEVVTSGGVCLDEINPKTMESKLVEGLYFCGEVIDVDGFCGGFNLQNCWSTGFVAGNNAC